ncbi:MAG: hypothetical protein ACTSUJ_05380 [Candidatus Njordarchaeales archaeon]
MWRRGRWIISSHNVYVLDYSKTRVYPARFFYTPCVDVKTSMDFAPGAVMLEEKVSKEGSGDILSVGVGISDFYEIYLGSTIIGRKNTFSLPYQVPIVFPMLGAFDIPVGYYPHQIHKDAGFIFVKITTDSLHNSMIFDFINKNDLKDFDPKTILKCFLLNYVLVFSFGYNTEIAEKISKEIMMVGRLQSSRDYIPQRKTIAFAREVTFPLIKGIVKDLQIKFRSLRLFRIEKLLKLICKESFSNYSSNLINMIKEFIVGQLRDFKAQKTSSSLEKARIKYVFSNYGEKLLHFSNETFKVLFYLALIELGLHGILHLIAKILIGHGAVSSSKMLGEVIYLGVPYRFIPENIRRLSTFETEFEGIIDGFIYRKIKNQEPLTAIGILFIRDSNSGKPFLESMSRLKLRDLLTRARELIGEKDQDTCYSKWLIIRNLRKKVLEEIKMALRTTGEQLSNCNNTSKHELLDKIIENVENVLGIGSINDVKKIRETLYMHALFARRYIYKDLTRKLAENILASKDQSRRNTNKDIKDCIREIRRELLHVYERIILEEAIPFCYDGCYNCVLWEDCVHPSPLVKPWIVSKEATRILLSLVESESMK